MKRELLSFRAMLRIGTLATMLMLTLTGQSLHSQELSARQHFLFTTGIINPASPEAHAMSKYGIGDINTNLNTGTLSMSIPVFTYKDLDFEIPISLDYASNGFMPNTTSPVTGLGWTLNAGGAITREINGIMDDAEPSLEIYSYSDPWDGHVQQRPNPRYTSSVAGYLWYCEVDENTREQMEQVCVYVNKAGEEYMPVNALHNSVLGYELSPDIFHFSYPGTCGSFLFQPQNAEGKKGLFFNTTEPAALYNVDYEISQLWKYLTKIEIFSPDKYIYEFSQVELAHNLSSNGSDMSISTPGSWRLTKITAPNGRYVEFEYDVVNVTETSYPVYISDKWTKRAEDPSFDEEGETAFVFDSFYIWTDVQSACLTKIKTSDNTLNINFSYSAAPNELGTRFGNKKKLDEIQVINSEGQIVKDCHLEYGSVGINSRLFLTEVNINGVGKYAFDYYGYNMSAPSIQTPSIDWHGYWNRSIGWENFVPLYYNVASDNSYLWRERGQDADATRYGLLKSITIPTGGHLVVEYEENKYDFDVTGKLDHFPMGGHITSGQRVKAIESYDPDNNLIQKKVYKYLKEDGMSSGRLLWRPLIYCQYRAYSSTFVSIQRSTISTASDFPFSNYPFIEYPRIEEHTYRPSIPDIKEITISEFVNSSDFLGRDSLTSADSAYRFDNNFLYAFTYLNGVTEGNYNSLCLSFQSNARGRLLKKTIYSDDYSHPIQSINYVYSGCPVGSFSYEKGTLGLIAVQKMDFDYPYVSTRHTTEFASNDSTSFMSSSDRYTIDNSYRLQSSISIDSRGRQLKTEYEYFDHVPIYLSSETQRTNGIITGRTKYSFQRLRDNLWVPFEIRTAELGGEEFTDVDDLEDSYETMLHFDSYDSQGRPTMITDENGVKREVSWQGSNPTSVSIMQGSSPLLTTGYTWKPLVGMTSQTAPNGKKQFFYYDSAGRLSQVEDDSHVILKIFDYHIVSE